MILRESTISDAKLLFEWSNDSVTRRNSFSDKPIVWEEHLSWLTKKLNDESSHLFIADDEEISVGTIRIDADDAKKELYISYNVAPDCRGKGYGAQLLKLVEDKMRRKYRGYVLVGEVKSDNTASQKCFEKCGFTGSDTVDRGSFKEIVFSKKL